MCSTEGMQPPPPPPPPLAQLVSTDDHTLPQEPVEKGKESDAPQPSSYARSSAASEDDRMIRVQQHSFGSSSSQPSYAYTIRSHPLTTIYVGNLSQFVEERAVFEAFVQFGFVQDVQIIRDKEIGGHKGYGFVTYASEESGAAALRCMDGARLGGPFQGIALRVSTAHQRVKAEPARQTASIMSLVKADHRRPDKVDAALSSLHTLSVSADDQKLAGPDPDTNEPSLVNND